MSSARLAPVAVEEAETASRVVTHREYSDAVGLLIQAPASLEGSITRTIEVSADGETFATFANADGAIALPAAGEAFSFIELVTARAWRIVYNTGPAETETWLVSKSW